MKSLALTALLALTGLGVFAQKLDKAKDHLGKKKYAEARNEIEGVLSQEKNKNNSEAWYTRARIYASIANDSTLKSTVPGARDTAYSSLMKYAELEGNVKEENKKWVAITADNRQALVDLYQGYSKDAAAYYNAGNFNDALANFKGSLNIFDFMAAKGWTQNTKLDTTTTLYAGISAEKAQKQDEAAIYYGKIAENKATGEGFVEIYKWLTDHYYRKDDLENSKKYLALGKEVYPKEEFWSAYELDMIREKGTKEELFAKYEETIKEHPDNYLTHFNYAVELYQVAYNPDSTQRPANSKELIGRAVEHLNHTLQLKADYPNANLVLGQIYYNQGVDISNVNKEIRPPKGGKLKPEELKKKQTLRDEMNKKYDEALVYFTKVDEALGNQGKLKAEEKRFLKETYDLMISIYDQKQNPDKVNEYTEKFNNVEKKHS